MCWCFSMQNLLVFFGLLLVLTSVSSEQEGSCELNIGGCKYEVKLKNKQCKPLKPFQLGKIRSKRMAQEPVETDKQQTPLTKDDFKHLIKKMTGTFSKLSTRILRWWRKLDRKINSMVGGGKRAASQSMKSKHRCPDGFVGIENWPSCYLMSHFNTSWYDAKDYCSAFESDLVALRTVREHFLLTFLIKNNQAINNVNGWWTSGSFIGNTRQWMWTSQFFTKPFTFIKWAEGEPNEDGSQCMLLKKSDNHLWHDDICTMKYNFICEMKVQVR